MSSNDNEKTVKPNKKPKASSENDKKPDENTMKPKMMKNGLIDRPLTSWIRILLVTTIWWSFVAGFFCLCFFLMNQIIYGSQDAQPYFARNFEKYPGILNQPSLNIKCQKPKDDKKPWENCDTTMLSIEINKMFKFVPESYEEYPKEMVDVLKKLGVTGELKKKHVFVTCEGRKEEDKVNLEGMKFEEDPYPGFDVTNFPWTEDIKKSWIGISFDLSSSKVVSEKTDVKVHMECKAWAKNIKTEIRFVDKKTPQGGALGVFCFKSGKIIKPEDCD